MRRTRLVILSVLFLQIFSAYAYAGRTGALVIARLTTVEDITQRPPGISPIGTYRLTFQIRKVLAGKPSHRTVQMVRDEEMRVVGYDYYLMLEKANDADEKVGSSDEVVWMVGVRRGLCVSDERATKYRMREVIDKLRKKYPCDLGP